MKIGDKVYLEDRESEITAISYDEQGEKIYTVKDSPKDYYEHDFYEFMHSELHATQNLLEEYKEAYADYQELGKEYAKLQDELETLKKKYYGLAALNRASLEEYDEQEKMIDSMAKALVDYANLGHLIKCPAEYDGRYFYKNCKIDVTKRRTNKTRYCCKECVKEYFRKKAKEMK